jgi:formylglycine-generating enzyme required for sulfatase activity
VLHGEVWSPVRATGSHHDYIPNVPSEPDVVVIAAGDALLEDPPRTLHVNVFAIARRPVTSGEFAEFVNAASYRAEQWSDGPADPPAEGISWADAVAYCRWLSIATARIYRLPDEREWEKAARAGVLEQLGAVREWTNTWADGARVLRGGSKEDQGDDRFFARRLHATDDLRGHGFRVVRSMTGR